MPGGMAMVKRAKGRCAHVATDVATWWRCRHRLSHRQQATGRAAVERGRVALRRPSDARPCAYNSCSSLGLCRPYPIPAVTAASKICQVTNALSTRERSRVGLYRHFFFFYIQLRVTTIVRRMASIDRNCGVYSTVNQSVRWF